MTKARKPQYPIPIQAAAVVPALIGAGIGALGSFGLNRRSHPSIFAAGLIGGITALVVWSTHGRLRAAAREFTSHLDTARDLRWLARNPIDYA